MIHVVAEAFSVRRAIAMSGQAFNGVRLGGTADQFTIINESDKPVIGYAVQRITDTGVNPISSVVLFNWLAAGKAFSGVKSKRFAHST